MDDSNFDSQIYVCLLKSYFNLNQFDKCGYFCRKFLRQIVLYLNKQINDSSAVIDLTTNEPKKKQLTNLTELITVQIELMLK